MEKLKKGDFVDYPSSGNQTGKLIVKEVQGEAYLLSNEDATFNIFIYHEALEKKIGKVSTPANNEQVVKLVKSRKELINEANELGLTFKKNIRTNSLIKLIENAKQ